MICTIIHMQPPATAARIAVLAVAVPPLGSQHLPANFMQSQKAEHNFASFALFTMHCWSKSSTLKIADANGSQASRSLECMSNEQAHDHAAM